MGIKVTILDSMVNGNSKWLNSVIDNKNLTFINGDIAKYEDVRKAVVGQDEVWHMAGNADIPLGYSDTMVDLEAAVCGTRNVLEAMVKEGVKNIIFTSSGAVYGNMAVNLVDERSGPLYPLSMYAAGKIAAEAYISSYCHLFGLNGYVFRFGNVLGERMSRGAIRDFITRLLKDNTKLTILGNGKQAKSYFLVEECLEGIMYVTSSVKYEGKSEIFNLGNPGTTSIVTIAKDVIEQMNLKNVKIDYSNREAWPGDQPIVNLDVTKVKKLGWMPKTNSDDAVKEATSRMYRYLKTLEMEV
jgi:UDP-glucose 4-epimerase